MSKNITDALRGLRDLEGYLGAALVDSDSGMTLGLDSASNAINLEIAAAGNTEVVRAKRRTIQSLDLKDDIEDILITLGKQTHLLRPMRSRPGIFVYVALERSRSNLALARLKLSEVEKNITV